MIEFDNGESDPDQRMEKISAWDNRGTNRQLSVGVRAVRGEGEGVRGRGQGGGEGIGERAQWSIHFSNGTNDIVTVIGLLNCLPDKIWTPVCTTLGTGKELSDESVMG